MALPMRAQDPVYSELSARIAAVGQRVESARDARGLAEDVRAIGALASAHRIGPAVTVVHALEAAIARGEHGALIRGWVDALQIALDCAPVRPN